MTSKKFFPAAILSLAVLFTACSAGGTEVSETVSETTSETVITTAAETTSATSETTAETTTTTEATTAEEIIDTSSVEYMKEALQADWDNSEYDILTVSFVTLYTADLNGDGVKELFVKYLLQPRKDGVTYVYDVSDGMKKLYEISARSSMDSKLYTDENGVVHYIFWSDYAGAIWEENYVYFDITYDSIKIPFYVDVYGYYDGGEHLFYDKVYKNCEFVPTNEINRNFDPEKAEFVGTFAFQDIRAVFKNGESNKVSEINEIIQKEVYAGMTYVSDIEMICESSGNVIDYNFEDFWQQAAPKLAEVYNK